MGTGKGSGRADGDDGLGRGAEPSPVDAGHSRRHERLGANPDNEADEAHVWAAAPSPRARAVLQVNADAANDAAHDEQEAVAAAAARREALGSNPDVEADEAVRVLRGPAVDEGRHGGVDGGFDEDFDERSARGVNDGDVFGPRPGASGRR